MLVGEGKEGGRERDNGRDTVEEGESEARTGREDCVLQTNNNGMQHCSPPKLCRRYGGY